MLVDVASQVISFKLHYCTRPDVNEVLKTLSVNVSGLYISPIKGPCLFIINLFLLIFFFNLAIFVA